MSSCTERRDGTETSGDKTRASTGLLGEMMSLYPHHACGFLDYDVKGGTSRDDSLMTGLIDVAAALWGSNVIATT